VAAPPRRVFPRSRPLVEPISRADAGFFGSAGFLVRVSLFGVLALLVFGILALRLWSLQVIRGPRYAVAAKQQTFRYVDLPTTRAPIVDRNGHVVAGSSGRIVLVADTPALGRLDARGHWHAGARGIELLRRAARVVGKPPAAVVRRIRADVIRSPYAPAVVVTRLKPALAFYFDERARDFPGFHVTVLPDRSYPQGALGSEFLGLLGEISAPQLKLHRYHGYKPGEVIGQSGVEATYDRLLNGGLDRARVAVDSLGRAVGPLRVLHRKQPSRVLRLTIDARLQRVARRAIVDGIHAGHVAGHGDAAAGAAVVMDARNGALLALASYPDFNQVAAARNPDYLGHLLSGKTGGLLNRATQGLYPTGSTFKPIVAAAALAGGLITPSTYLPCTGSYTVGNVVFHNVEPGINESMNLGTALAVSCDTWFYRLGYQFYLHGGLGMQRWAKALGLGHPTGLDVAGEYAGLVPTPRWLKRTRGETWYPGQSVNLSIGQGFLAVTPLQLAVAYAALANGGRVVTPHVGAALLGPQGELVRRLRFPPRRRLRLTDGWAIRDGLYAAAHSAGGTSASIFGSFPVPVAGKTGTAQTPFGSDHSWYASWAPADHPRYVVVVLIEHGGFGAEAAAPAAREIYQALFHVR
jgi:penicillin-binding protein 2